MSWLKFTVLLYVITVLQISFIPVVFPSAVQPLLFVIFANIILLVRRIDRAVLSALVIGFIADLTSIVPLGTMTFAFGVYGVTIIFLRPMLFIESPLAHSATVVVGIIIIYTIQAIFSTLTSNVPPLPYTVLEIFGQMVVNGLISGGLAYYFPMGRKYRYKFGM